FRRPELCSGTGVSSGARRRAAKKRDCAYSCGVESMRALTVAPGIADSAGVEDVADPPQSDGAVLVRTLALGVCGTDREIVSGAYVWAPPGEYRLGIGHESCGSVEEAPAGCGVEAGDHVVGIVRRPDPVPCSACAGT